VKKCFVFGKNGLIGKSVVDSLIRSGHSVYANARIDWKNNDIVCEQIKNSVAAFFNDVKIGNWMIFWFAGKGGFSVSEEQLDFDRKNFECLLESVERFMKRPGLVVLASSAGALYCSESGLPFDESSTVHPNSLYGKLKVDQEAALSSFAEKTDCPVLITRISTVYGPGSDFTNGYGLINHLCMADITRRPLEIFVPMDTSRNYIYSKDAGELVVRFALKCTEDVKKKSIRNVVAPSSVSISEIVATCSKVFKRKVLISNRIDGRQISYSTRFDIKSLHIEEIEPIYWTPISVGISQVRQSLSFELQSIGVFERSNR
jgi:UDP-glucose 4-epimerase